ncbi:MAG: hypothetical protein ACRC6E_04540 [Fusobacteriaceae bacterium]
MNSTPKNSENTVVDKIKISLLLIVLFIAFLFRKDTQNPLYVTQKSVETNISSSKTLKTSLNSSEGLFSRKREEKTNNIGE